MTKPLCLWSLLRRKRFLRYLENFAHCILFRPSSNWILRIQIQGPRSGVYCFQSAGAKILNYFFERGSWFESSLSGFVFAWQSVWWPSACFALLSVSSMFLLNTVHLRSCWLQCVTLATLYQHIHAGKHSSLVLLLHFYKYQFTILKLYICFYSILLSLQSMIS